MLHPNKLKSFHNLQNLQLMEKSNREVSKYLHLVCITKQLQYLRMKVLFEPLKCRLVITTIITLLNILMSAVSFQGVEIPCVLHDARYLTEQKESSAKHIVD